MTEREQTTCRTRATFGWCGRPAGHAGPHAVPVGDDVWYGYTDRLGYGYGRVDGDTFTPLLDNGPLHTIASITNR